MMTVLVPREMTLGVESEVSGVKIQATVWQATKAVLASELMAALETPEVVVLISAPTVATAQQALNALV